MMFKYPCISSGYVGIFKEKQTLNARFYSSLKIHGENSQLNEVFQLPQRIPRTGIFDELLNLETYDYNQAFQARIKHISDQMKLSLDEATTGKSNSAVRKFINFSNLALRYGNPQLVIDHASLISTIHTNILEVDLLKESALISRQLSTGTTISTKNLLLLAEKYLSSSTASEREKIMLLNQLIVSSYRHERVRDSKIFLAHANNLLHHLEKHENTSFFNRLRCSIGYRGLAMVLEFGVDLQNQMLKRAEEIALSLHSNNKQENILALENLYTCLQSITKWHIHHQAHDKAEKYFNSMIEVDPLDSTGHSELGLYHIQHGNYDKAAIWLKSAMLLGPPGTAMNTYYYAKCLELTDKTENCIQYLIAATSMDNSALSPWIDLFEIYKNKNEITEAKSCANHILSTQILRSQLEHEEANILQNYIN